MKYQTELETSNKKIRQLSIRNEKIKENESKRIAGDLHDSVAQNIAGARLMVNKLEAEQDLIKIKAPFPLP